MSLILITVALGATVVGIITAHGVTEVLVIIALGETEVLTTVLGIILILVTHLGAVKRVLGITILGEIARGVITATTESFLQQQILALNKY
jgi:hypothetical protein